MMEESKRAPIRLEYERSARNTDLDPQLVWRGKDEQDWSNLVVTAPPIFIQEKVHPRALINDLIRHSRRSEEERQSQGQANLFADFNGLDDPALRSDYYNHEQNWSNRMILGDSLQVMASLASREGLQGRVQCIYIDPPYGLGFNSNFQWSTNSRDVRDGNAAHITREPEQVKAFRDTWRDGINSYLTYLRDRLTVARDLLADSGSIFVQIGDENVHRVRVLMDEVFRDENFVSQIVFQTSSGRISEGLDGVYDVLLWYARNRPTLKYRENLRPRNDIQLNTAYTYLNFPDGTYRPLTSKEREGADAIPIGAKRFRPGQTQSQSGGESARFVLDFEGKSYSPPSVGGWRTSVSGFNRAARASRLMPRGRNLAFRQCNDDYPFVQLSNIWTDTLFVSFGSEKTFVVQTNPKVIQRLYSHDHRPW